MQPVDLDPTRNPNMPGSAPSADPAQVDPVKTQVQQIATAIMDGKIPIGDIVGEMCKRTGTQVIMLIQVPRESLGIDLCGPTSLADAYKMTTLAQTLLDERVRAQFRQTMDQVPTGPKAVQ